MTQNSELKADISQQAAQLYGAWAGNHPTIHCNRLASWNELSRETQRQWIAVAEKVISTRFAAAQGGVVEARGNLTSEYLALTPAEKWGCLAVNGLLGTDEPWIADMFDTLAALSTKAEGMEAAAVMLDVEAELEKAKTECAKAEAGTDRQFWRRYWAGYARCCEALLDKFPAIRAAQEVA